MFNRFLLAIDHISKSVYGLYKVVPPQWCLLVYKPHEYYKYIYHKP